MSQPDDSVFDSLRTNGGLYLSVQAAEQKSHQDALREIHGLMDSRLMKSMDSAETRRIPALKRTRIPRVLTTVMIFLRALFTN